MTSHRDDDLCDEYVLSPTLFYAWQKLFLDNRASASERKSGLRDKSHLRTIASLRDKLQCKNEVVAELMEEDIQLKKSLGISDQRLGFPRRIRRLRRLRCLLIPTHRDSSQAVRRLAGSCREQCFTTGASSMVWPMSITR
jgi:transposase